METIPARTGNNEKKFIYRLLISVTSFVPLTLGLYALGHLVLVTAKRLILKCMFAENQNYCPITDRISGRRPLSTAISAYHSADIIREIQHIFVTKCPKVSGTEEVYD